MVSGQDAKSARDSLLTEFKATAPEVLDRPFSGMLQVVWPDEKKEGKHEIVRLNFLRPGDSGKGHSPINTPYLATTKDGKSYSGAFALRANLPATEHLTSFSDYKEIVRLLGAPTHLPFGGETDNGWAYDTVIWQLFAPTDADSIEILQIRIARKYRFGDVPDGKYLIESYSVSRGTLTKMRPSK